MRFQKDREFTKRPDRDNRAKGNESAFLKPEFAVELARIEKELGGTRYPDIVESLELLSINPEDEQLKELLLEDATMRLEESIISGDPFRATAPTEHDDLDGEIVLGQTMSGTIYAINADSLTTHALVLGSSGTGKTQLLLLIACQMLQKRRR